MAAAELAASERKVVIDAGAAIRLQRLERFGKELYTTSGVLAEIRDEKARALLGTLPTELKVRQPLPQDLAYAKQFAKATGDLGFLSHNDLELIALTVALHRETGGELRDRPAPLGINEGQCAFDWAPAGPEKPSAAGAAGSTAGPEKPSAAGAAGGTAGPAAAGAAAPAEDEAASGAKEPAAEDAVDEGSRIEQHELGHAVALSMLRARADSEQAAAAQAASDPTAEPAPEPAPAGGLAAPGAGSPAKAAAEEAEAAAEEERDSWDEAGEDEDGSSAGEWVTPENVHRFGVGVETSVSDAKVTCATADYSVQNVLLQMGITPHTFDGYAVRSVKMWGLLCKACYHFTRDTQKVFCPKCGNDTCVRVPIVVGADGKPTVVHNGRKLRTKGTVFSIPKPQGGRGWKPIFAEDELRIGGRDRQLRHQQKVCEKEKALKDPFDLDNGTRAWYQRSTTSTGRMIGHDMPRVQAGYGRRNPNANNFKFKAGKRR